MMYTSLLKLSSLSIVLQSRTISCKSIALQSAIATLKSLETSNIPTAQDALTSYYITPHTRSAA
ncbi:putative lipoprotein [Anaplasma phagocytophilum str. ApNP]|uniref:Putative lipoprotein n=1 Tax=Anaplasma phagocytophilum str. ApNP TaxID=1359153 RepID=A0A0F3NIX5_ANAPH|nr:putative lipoprotein [Anaplasma phagocytophilum str. ApNP]